MSGMNDRETRVPLGVLDPGCGDPGYWWRFQKRVMDAAQPVLAHRRRARVTVGGVMASWSRMILPATLAAAVVAMLFLFGEGPAVQSESLASVEDVLGLPTDGEEPLPSFLHSDETVDRNVVLFAVEQS